MTDVPAQIDPDGDAAILTPAVNIGLTFIVMALEVAGLPVAHVRLDVRTTYI